MAKLNQIIAIEKGIKSRVCSDVSELYKTVQKAELFNGFAKTYRKKDVTVERAKLGRGGGTGAIQGQTHEQLADEFGVSIPTIRKALRIAA